jgi:two-component system cell cycle response regulator
MTRSERDRSRSARWRDRLRPVVYGLLLDAVIVTVILIAQRRTKTNIKALARRVRGEQGAPFTRGRFLGNGNIEDFEVLAGELEQLRQMATTDLVTGLPNFAKMQSDLLSSTENAAAENVCLSLSVVDLDHFKKVNDDHGHDVGNAALAHVAQQLVSSIGPEGRAGRWGGDEFVLLLPGLDLEQARERAEVARKAVEDHPLLLADGSRVSLTVTIGVAAGRGASLEAGRLFRAADQDLLETKGAGRNRVGCGRLI